MSTGRRFCMWVHICLPVNAMLCFMLIAFDKYAMGQPVMCRLLIEWGADVDCVANTRGVHGHFDNYMYVGDWYIRMAYPCLEIHPNTVKNSRAPLAYADRLSGLEHPQHVLACRGYLLDAGCDPTIPIFQYPYLDEVLEKVAHDAFRSSFATSDIVQQPRPGIILYTALTMPIPGCYDDDAG